MADPRVPFLETLRKAALASDEDLLRELVEHAVHFLMDLEVSAQIGAERHERSESRTSYRNGTRSRPWETRVGSIELRIPKLRSGSYFPSTLLEPRRRAERALISVVQEAYVHGVSTRKVDDLVSAMGLEGMDKSRVSRLCQDLDDLVEEFRNRPLEEGYPYVWLDATYVKVRLNGRVTNMALVVAVGVDKQGDRRVLGLDLGPAEDEHFWLQFLRGLVVRGLKGVELVVSDAHVGLKKAIVAALAGASWQRCRVHFMRNVLSHVGREAQHLVGAAVRSIFNEPDQSSAHRRLQEVAEKLATRFPRVRNLLLEAAEDVLAYMAFPEMHRRRLHSTNPLERLHKEIKRRTDVVGIFPTPKAAIRLTGALLAEQDDEWETARRYFSLESMKRLRSEPSPPPEFPLALEHGGSPMLVPT